MHDFTDSAGRSWTLTIHVAAVKRVRAALGVDLYTLVDDRFAGLAELLSDLPKFVDVLYVLCREQADGRAITDEQFGESMAGDALERATTAFTEELVDFFPDPRKRAALRKVMTASRELQTRILERGIAELETIDLDSLANTAIASSTSSPASSESIPAPSPGTS